MNDEDHGHECEMHCQDCDHIWEGVEDDFKCPECGSENSKPF